MPETGEVDLMSANSNPRAKSGVFFLVPVYLVVFSAFFDTHAQMPVLAPYAVTLGATPFILGIVVGSYSLFNILGNFFSGMTIDRKSWKLPLFLGLAGVSLILVLYTRADNALHLVMIRASHGFMGGLLVPAALACLTGQQGGSAFHGSRLALFGATIGMAAVTGPLVAGIVATRFGFDTVYYSLAVIMFVAAIGALGFLGRQPVCSLHNDQPPISYSQIFIRPKMLSAFLFAFGTMGSVGALATFLPTRSGMLGFNHAQTGMLFTTFAFTAIVMQVLWPGRLKPIYKEDCRGCYFGIVLLCMTLVFAASANSSAGLFIALGLFGIGFGLSFQGMLGMVIDDSRPGWRGRAIGFFFAVYSLGVAVVPPLSGLIWQHLPSIFPFYSAAVAALVSLIAGGLYLRKRD